LRQGCPNRLGVEDGNIRSLSLETLHLEVLNHERSEASSKAGAPIAIAGKLPDQKCEVGEPNTAAGEMRPWRAKDTPIKEIE